MSRPLLYDYFRSSAAYRVRIALNLKQIDYESRPVDLRAGEQKADAYREISPQGLVPVTDTGLRKASRSSATSTRDSRSSRCFRRPRIFGLM
jgi:maleylacetoacetate isomerase/maleylpyruvate isomerase